ncbi:hypothetical protein [Microbacterium sp. T32]|uniref:hypothetical protein n=1 Tax=Microbacterium sp. T32 TaxID=1776083 RepID=UPI0007AC1B75|nr:hypothetical protein [Microbacterium sp. T32]KZE41308.1 hypothetical protein AVW09_01595 [Microbacterium sp. T32]
MRLRAGTIAITGLLLLMTGCSTMQGDATVEENVTIDQAKTIAQEMETTLAGFVPPDQVASIAQNPTGALMSCSKEGDYLWSGQTKVILEPGTTYDGDAVTSKIAAAYDGSKSYRTETDMTTDGQPRAHVIGENGEGYLVALSVDKTFVQILSFSPCFVLPDDVSPSKPY